MGNVPRTIQNLAPNNHQLRDNTEQIQMRAVRKQKVPQLQHLWQRRRTRTHCQYRSESVNSRFHIVRHEMRIQFLVHDLEHAIHKRKTLVHTLHAAAHVPGTFLRDEALETREGFDFAAGGVEEGPAEDVHALHVSDLLGVVGRTCFCARARHETRIWGTPEFTECWG
jgi:hypothetical protein